jgi:hypothetical protein
MLGVAIVVCGISQSCSQQQTMVDRQKLVGSYVYRATDSGAYHDPDRLDLSGDGTYLITRMPGGGPSSTHKGVWTLVEVPEPTVLIDHTGYPVRTRGRMVQLLVNVDLGQWYEKLD